MGGGGGGGGGGVGQDVSFEIGPSGSQARTIEKEGCWWRTQGFGGEEAASTARPKLLLS